MNQNFKKVMDLLSEIKGAFHKKEASNFEQATLVDGVTVIEYEALEVGMPVFVVADGEMIPAPEGTHALSGDMEGVSIVVDAEGIITEVIDTREVEQSSAPVSEESAESFETISSEELPAVLEQVTETIADELGLEMGKAYDIASVIVAKINEITVEQMEEIVNSKMESFTKAVEGLAEMTKAIDDNNTRLLNELSSLKSEFEAFKAQPSVETRENEKFSKVGNLTTRQAFLLKNK